MLARLHMATLQIYIRVWTLDYTIFVQLGNSFLHFVTPIIHIGLKCNLACTLEDQNLPAR